MPSSVEERRKRVAEFASELLELGANLLISSKEEKRSAYDTAELEEMFAHSSSIMLAALIRAAVCCDCDPLKVIKVGLDVLEESRKDMKNKKGGDNQ